MSVAHRPSWEETFMGVAELMSRRATCPRLHTGAVVVDPITNRILSTGYNGSPSGAKHCEDVGCILEGDHCIRVVHAELNALLFGARQGISLSGATMYVLHMPCSRCSMMIAQAGISEVVYYYDYKEQTGLTRLEEYGVKVRKKMTKKYR